MSDSDPLMASFAAMLARYPVLEPLDIAARARRAVRLMTERVAAADSGHRAGVLAAESALGASRFGGIPDVPPGFEWPTWKVPRKHRDAETRLRHFTDLPLAFIAQLDLSTIPRVSDLLPDTGWLYFFYDFYSQPWGFDPEDRGSCRVIYANCQRSELAPLHPPANADPEHVFHRCHVESQGVISIPSDLSELKYGTAECDAYEQLCEELRLSGTGHSLLGYPIQIQGDMQLECQLVTNGLYCGDASGYSSARAKSLEPGSVDWILLLQVDSDEDGPGWMWGDCGRIYFWIRRQDLQACDFENVWLVLQCY